MASVDIVVPCYQYGHFLRECVTSILSQGVRDLRVLVIDDASTDDSGEVARQLTSEDCRVEVVSHRINRGHIATYNEGIDWASSDFFLLLSADDLLVPGCLARAISIMEQHADVVFAHGCEVTILPGESPPAVGEGAQEAEWRISTGRQFIEGICRSTVNFVRTSTVVVRTPAQKAVGHYRSELPHAGDMEMWLRLASIGSIAETTVVQGIRRQHGLNMSIAYMSGKLRDLFERENVFESFFANEGCSMPGAGKLHRQAKRSLAEQAYWFGLSHLARGYLVEAYDRVKFAFRLYPVFAVLPPLGYIIRMDGLRDRITDVVAESVGRLWCKFKKRL
jgi:glycosyltransferase involved in cell wall biosynthesis